MGKESFQDLIDLLKTKSKVVMTKITAFKNHILTKIYPHFALICFLFDTLTKKFP